MTIEQRMELLERTIRRWRRLAGTMAVLVVTGVGIGAVQMNADELTLRKLAIQDEFGRDRIVLDTNFLIAAIRHYDANGNQRISSGTMPNGFAAIRHYDANGNQRISSGTTADGKSGISHFDMNGKGRITSSTHPEGNAGIDHSDVNGKRRISSGTNADGEAFTLWTKYDANGKIQIAKELP